MAHLNARWQPWVLVIMPEAVEHELHTTKGIEFEHEVNHSPKGRLRQLPVSASVSTEAVVGN